MTTEADGDLPGARWWKFDFHTHTPASVDTPWAREGVVFTPEEWLLGYMRAKVDCIAVTDHNSGGWIDRLKLAYAQMLLDHPEGFRPLHIFPGVEISVNGGIHLLAIFDKDRSTSDIDTLLGKVDYPGSKGNSDSVTRKSAAEVIAEIVEAGGLAIPAHVDGPKGMLQLRDTAGLSAAHDANTLRQICETGKVIAMEVLDPRTAKPHVYAESGCTWTEVIGSDSHSFQGDRVPGSRFTWIKMDGPSIEGLRLALLDGARFSVRRSDDDDPFDPFHRPEHFIEEIRIENARYMGRGEPALLRFSPWFNALVGGRGTGKSTVVHSLRLAYRRDSEVEKFGIESDLARVFKLFTGVRKNRADAGGVENNTEIVVTLSRDGVPYRLRWRKDASGVVVEERRSSDWQAATSQSVAHERFPVRIFSQGQIAALAGESQDALLALIDEVAQTREAKRSLEEATSRFLALRAQTRELDGRLAGRDEVSIRLEDVTRKLAAFEGTDIADVLRAYQRRVRQVREVDRQLEAALSLSFRVVHLAEDLVTVDPPDGVFAADDTTDQSVLGAIDRIRQAVTDAASDVRLAGEGLQGTITEVRESLSLGPRSFASDEASARYAALTAELQSRGVADPNEYGKLVQERQRLETELDRFNSLQSDRDQIAVAAHEQRLAVRRSRQALSQARHSFLDETIATNAYVRMALVPYGQEATLVAISLRDVLGVNDDRFKNDILAGEDDEPQRGLVVDLRRDMPEEPSEAATTMESRLDELGLRFERAVEGGAEFGGHFNKYLVGACSSHPEMLDRLLVFSPEDALKVEYSPKGDGTAFRSIAQASAGQKAAAMLAFLLAHGTEPIVLDQPEDDLDNHLIYDLVVRQIRENKMRRQLIVVTHNPNIVVNGDAEMLHVLDFHYGQCRVMQSGSLQEVAMREEVCRVMEGGREAFERRYKRLGKES